MMLRGYAVRPSQHVLCPVRPVRVRKAPCRPLAKMYVPSDSFGGVSPERKAADALRTLFTFIAVKVILAQLEGSGRGALSSYNTQQFSTLQQALADQPFKDGDVWLESLMQRDHMLALRVIEVRDAYARDDFEWDQLQRLVIENTAKANIKLMRNAAAASLTATLQSQRTDASEEEPSP